MANVVLLLVMLSTGAIVVTCLDFGWLRPSLRNGRRRFAHRGHQGTTTSSSVD